MSNVNFPEQPVSYLKTENRRGLGVNRFKKVLTYIPTLRMSMFANKRTPDGEGQRYGTIDELESLLLYRQVKEWGRDYLLLDNGVKVSIEMSESDCCARAEGHFSDVELDAVITNIIFSEPSVVFDEDYETKVCRSKITMYHNQNIVALGDFSADSGRSGYYYSVSSLVIGDIHFPVADTISD